MRVLPAVMLLAVGCGTPAAEDKCLAGSRVCDGNVVLLCRPETGFEYERGCPTGSACAGGQCVAAGPDGIGFADTGAPDVVAPADLTPVADTGELVDLPDTATPDPGPELPPPPPDVGPELPPPPLDVGPDLPDVPPPPSDEGPDTPPPPACGNGKLDPGEICDKGISGGPDGCPTSCDDPPGCTGLAFAGSVEDCTARCETYIVQDPIDDDGCCPLAGTPQNDTDCITCGNGKLDSNEICDSSSSKAPCPTACPAAVACDGWKLLGDAATCDAKCAAAPVTELVSGDGCCPDGGTKDTDTDCAAICGDGKIGPGEQCDGLVLPPKSCADLGFGPGAPTCLPDCTLSTLTCSGGHLLLYDKVKNAKVNGDFLRVRWHPSGTFALLLSETGAVVRYDAATQELETVTSLTATGCDLDVSKDGSFFLIVGTVGKSGKLWRATVAKDGTLTVVEELALTLGSPSAIALSPDGVTWGIGAKASNTLSYLYRFVDGEGLVKTKGYNASAGFSDLMWAVTDLYDGVPAIMTSDGVNGADSHTWHPETDTIITNGWSPGFGNPGGAAWRPGGSYGFMTGWTSNIVYVFTGVWDKTYLPGPNGESPNAVAWKADGSRALIVGRAIKTPLEATVIDYRAGGKPDYDPNAWAAVPVSGFDKTPFFGNGNMHLLGVDFRPATACDEGLIVGTDSNGGSSLFGMIVRFHDQDDPDCP